MFPNNLIMILLVLKRKQSQEDLPLPRQQYLNKGLLLRRTDLLSQTPFLAKDVMLKLQTIVSLNQIWRSCVSIGNTPKISPATRANLPRSTAEVSDLSSRLRHAANR